MIPGIPAFKSPEKATELQPLVAEMISHLSLAMTNLRTGAMAEYPRAVAEVDAPPAPAQTSPQPEYAAPSPQEQIATKISTLDDVRRAREQAARAYAEAATSPTTEPVRVPAQPAETVVVDLEAARRARELAAEAYAETTSEAAPQTPYKDPNDAAA